MARVEPLRALHYDPAVAGPLQHLAAPPYDVIDPAQRAAYKAAFPTYIIGTYADRLFDYANAEVKVGRATPAAGGPPRFPGGDFLSRWPGKSLRSPP